MKLTMHYRLEMYLQKAKLANKIKHYLENKDSL